jgi:hypothetical protein
VPRALTDCRTIAPLTGSRILFVMDMSVSMLKGAESSQPAAS